MPGCSDLEEPYAALVMRHVRQRGARYGESLLANSAVYLSDVDARGGCPLSGAAAFLTAAWGRFSDLYSRGD